LKRVLAVTTTRAQLAESSAHGELSEARRLRLCGLSDRKIDCLLPTIGL
jgi:hypothetical protein